MPIIPQWVDDEQTVFLFHFTTPLANWQEYREAIEEGVRQMNTVDHPIITVFDPYHYPMPSGNPLPHLRHAVKVKPSHLIAVITISTNRVLNTVVDWIKKVGFNPWWHVVETQAEADALIEEIQLSMTETKELTF